MVISIGLITAKEADDLLALPPEKRAAAISLGGATAAAAAATPTAPGRLMPPGAPGYAAGRRPEAVRTVESSVNNN